MNGIKYQEYELLNGQKKRLVKQVKDGSIITRFDKTPAPKKPEDVVCPHFMELKWGYGCPFNCSWCFLKGTLRMVPTKTKPVAKSYDKIEKHLTHYFENDGLSQELLNSGELADSLMTENSKNPFSRFIMPLFEEQKRHKLLMLTKSDNVKNICNMGYQKQTIMSFTLNAAQVSKKWERAPAPFERIKAGKKLSELGYQVRVRIDPIVPIEDWKKDYVKLLNKLFESYKPERITLGSLRGLASTIRNCPDKSWVRYLNENSNWGKKISFEKRLEIYSFIKNYLHDNFNYDKIALCKETISMWDELYINYRNISCNCLL